MTFFDYLILFILICSVVISTMRGLIKEILSLLSWTVSFFVANAYSESLASLLPEIIPGQMVRMVVAFISLFIGVKLLMSLLMLAVDALISASGLKLADRGLGGLFGFARGCILIFALFIICGMTSIPQQPFWKEAMFLPVVEASVKLCQPLLPGSVSSYLKLH